VSNSPCNVLVLADCLLFPRLFQSDINDGFEFYILLFIFVYPLFDFAFSLFCYSLIIVLLSRDGRRMIEVTLSLPFLCYASTVELPAARMQSSHFIKNLLAKVTMFEQVTAGRSCQRFAVSKSAGRAVLLFL